MKNSYRIMTTLALAAVLVLAMAAPALASGVALPKALGAVGFTFDGQRSFAEFTAHATGVPAPGEEHAPAKGVFAFQTRGLTYVAKVEHIHAHAANEVHFGGKIVNSSDPTLVGKIVHVAVVDGGTPGSRGDTIAILISDTDVHEHGVPVPVTIGNLVVRTR